jgi:Arc/MetJ-type ribon-helix-helix transcriptional regulator
MVQAQFSLDESLWAFVQRSAQYGFQNQDELIRVALGKLQQELQALEMSADLYAEVYAEDADLQALTSSAIVGWAE